MNNKKTAYLTFHPQLNRLGKNKELTAGLSVALQIGRTVWVANDETISLEKLTLQEADDEGNFILTEHIQYPLNDFLPLPVPPSNNWKGEQKIEEADIEGLDYDDGYLWLVGSHSLKRKKADKKDTNDNFKALAKVSCDGNRFLLARIPLANDGNTYQLKINDNDGDKRRTAALLQGNEKTNDLIDELRKDEHLKMFLDIPGKDNGFDIEGLAVAGESVFLGLRGPVLRGWAVVLQLELDEDTKEENTQLKIKSIQKHFLDLSGLGIRDLSKHGDDLLVLAGPTMVLDGPVTIFRWKNATQLKKESITFRDDLQNVMDVPYGKGEDYAEGISLFTPDLNTAPQSILVVYDSAAKSRLFGESGVKADIFPLL